MKPSICLVSPKYGRNIGAVARAMSNFGVDNLLLVAPRGKPLSKGALAWASGGEAILHQAKIYPTLGEALANYFVSVGATSLRGRKIRQPVFPLRDFLTEAPKFIHAPWVLVFGPEDRGLSNTERQLCTHLVTIETVKDKPTLNLAQSVLCCLYTLSPLYLKPHKGPPRATLKEMEGLYDHLQKLLVTLGFLEPHNPERIMMDLRTVLGRAGLTPREVRILRGVLRKLHWFSQKLQDLSQG